MYDVPLFVETIFWIRRPSQSYAQSTLIFEAIGAVDRLVKLNARFSASQTTLNRPLLVMFPSRSYANASGVCGTSRLPVLVVMMSALVPLFRMARLVNVTHCALLVFVTG